LAPSTTIRSIVVLVVCPDSDRRVDAPAVMPFGVI
jgi:hypothetical protein